MLVLLGGDGVVLKDVLCALGDLGGVLGVLWGVGSSLTGDWCVWKVVM